MSESAPGNPPEPPLAGPPRLVLFAVAAGLLGGTAAVTFRALAVALPALVWPASSNLVEAVAAAPWWWKLGIPVAGALLAGLVLNLGSRMSGAVRGWDILEAVVLRDGILHLRSALVKALSALLTVASAGPLGREGPMVALSAAACSAAARQFQLPVRQRRLLVSCGIAAGLATAYNAPIGAALFTMEVIVGNFALDVFAPLVFASVTATLLARAAFSDAPVFDLPHFELASAAEIGLYALLGLSAGVAAAAFLRALRAGARLSRATGLPRPVTMAIAGALLGVTILWMPEVVGNGREAIVDLFRENWTARFALTLFAVRLVLGAVTVGAGAVGGVFTPTLLLGALLGDAFGSMAHAALPGLTADPKAYALVGMGCLLAGTTHAPISAVLLLSEMTLDPEIVLPLLVGAAVASLVARRIDAESIYTEALRRKRGAPGPQGEAAVMHSLTVSDVMRGEHATVAADAPLPELIDRFIELRRNHLYVVDAGGDFVGAISLYEASRALRETEDPRALRAMDVANPAFQTTVPSERLDRTLERFWVHESERMPVLASAGSRRIVGTVSKRDILGVYSLEVLHRRSLLARFEPGTPGERPVYVELPGDHVVDEIVVPRALVGTTLAQARFRDSFGVSVLVLRRVDAQGKVTRLLPEGTTRFEAGDRIIVFGERGNVEILAARARDHS